MEIKVVVLIQATLIQALVVELEVDLEIMLKV